MASIRVHRRNAQGTPTVWKTTERLPDGTWKSKYFDSEEDAKRSTLLAGLQELENGTNSSGTQALFLPVWQKFLERYAEGYSESTKSNYYQTKLLVEKHVIRMSDYNTDTLITAIKTKKNHKYRTRNTYISKLKRFEKWCKKNGYPAMSIDWEKVNDETLKAKKKQKDDKKFISIEEYRKIWEWFLNKSMSSKRVLIEVLAERGFRINELCKSTMDDIDLNTKSITIRAKIEKTREGKTVYLGEGTIQNIKQEREKYNTTGSNAIFIDERTGGPLRYRTMAKWWRICCKELKIYQRPIHRLRALAFFLIYKTSNHNIELAKQICGWHSSAYKHYVLSFRGEMEELDWIIKKTATGWIDERGHDSIGTKLKEVIEGNPGLKEKLMADLGIDKFWMDNFLGFGWNNDLVRIEKICKVIGYTISLNKNESSTVSTKPNMIAEK